MHRMYLGQYQLGIALLFTLGLCGFGQLVDLTAINKEVEQANLKAGDQAHELGKTSQPNIDVASQPKAESPSDEVDELDLEQASIEETMRKLRE